MSQRFCLFYAGFCAQAPALYYNQLLLMRQYELETVSATNASAGTVIQRVADQHYEQESNLRTAESIARFFELEVPALPTSAETYFEWLPQYIGIFEQSFPMSRIDHYYFLFGRRVSEMLCNLSLAAWCLDIHAESGALPDLAKRVEKPIRDNEFILFKLIAPAALLSSEPRQNFFNVYYKKINSEFEPFRELDAGSFDTATIKKLSEDLKLYEQEVMRGFKECVGKLKELGV